MENPKVADLSPNLSNLKNVTRVITNSVLEEEQWSTDNYAAMSRNPFSHRAPSIDQYPYLSPYDLTPNKTPMSPY